MRITKLQSTSQDSPFLSPISIAHLLTNRLWCLSAVHLQETRIAKLLVQLKSRLQPFCAGEAEAFREVQCINAEQLAAASFGSVMLQVGTPGLEILMSQGLAAHQSSVVGGVYG
jgi:hypothetical protein